MSEIDALLQRIQTDPTDVNALNDLGVAMARQKHFNEAINLLKRASDLDPARKMVWANLAAAYSDSNQLEAAEECLARLASLDPETAKTFRELGRVQRKRHRCEAAVDSLSKAIVLTPNDAEIYLDLGLVYSELEHKDKAKEVYEKALELRPDYAQAHNNLGVLLKNMGQLKEGIKHLREAVRLQPKSAGDHNNLGVALAEDGEYEEAVACYQEALSIDPKHILAWNNLGNAQRTLGKSRDAIASLQTAMRLKPDYAEAANNLAIACLHAGDIEEAMKNYDRAILLKPDYAEARMNRALVWLSLGRFDAGWAEYEWRWHLQSLRSRALPGHRWDGSALNGKRILVRCEQGLGDTFQFVRYMPLLKQRGACVVFEGQPVIREILSRTSGIDEFIPRGTKPSGYDFYTTLLSLPGLLDTRLESVPVPIPYIIPDDAIVDRWKERLSALGGFKVGIAWQGNPQHKGDRQRSVPLEQFELFSQIDGVKLVSLQRGFGTEQIRKLKSQFDIETFEGIDEEVDGFQRTAAIIKNLDLLITVDTSVAHLAGAMGVPVWVALPMAPDWRWLRDREDSPWYPSMRLFRKKKDRDWKEVFDRLSDALREKVAESNLAANSSESRDPEKAKQLLRQGNELISSGQTAKAGEVIEQAVTADPLNSDVHHDLGVALAKQGKLSRAISCFRRALQLRPNNAMAYGNLGLAFLNGERIEESIAHLRRAIHFGGGSADVYNNLGIALMRLPDPAAAIDNYLRALCLKPNHAAVHYNLARALLLQGDFDQGWLEYEWRHECLETKKHEITLPQWTGNSIVGNTLLLYGEQGYGDVIQFARYISIIKQRFGARIVLECLPEIVSLMKGCSGVDAVIASGSAWPKCNLQAPLLSLPAILGTTLGSIPAPVPYLSAEIKLVDRWKERLSELGGFKVGIAWQGNPQHKGDRQRSVPLEQFELFSQIDGVKLVSLQRGFGTEQIRKLKSQFDIETFEGIDEEVDGFQRTAAIIKNLDLLITVDTSVAHLAGAMGVPVWVALPIAPDWRWLRDREDSPWYPSMRLFRQGTRSDWQSVFKRMSAELKQLIRASVFGEAAEAYDTRHSDTYTGSNAKISRSMQKKVARTVVPVERILQARFDVAVVVPTIVRPSLRRAIRSIFSQKFAGRIQILIGIDKCIGDRSLLSELEQDCPQNCVLTILDLGYSTSSRNGGLYRAMPGGALRTILSYAANSTRIAYLDDDNWYGESHLDSLCTALKGNEWAYSLRWYVDQQTQNPICVDQWESIGPAKGVYAEKLGGFVDPNCLMIDKIACEPMLRWWCFPAPEDRRGISEDRQVFRHLKECSRIAGSGLPTVYYVIHPEDDLHPHRLKWAEEASKIPWDAQANNNNATNFTNG